MLHIMQDVKVGPASGSSETVMYEKVTLDGFVGPRTFGSEPSGFIVTLFSHPFKDEAAERYEQKDVCQVSLESGEFLWALASQLVPVE